MPKKIAETENWNSIPDDKTIAETIDALKRRGMNVLLVERRADALAKIKELVPEGAEIMNGSSMTLNEIGFTDYLKGKHGWKDLHLVISSEGDTAKRADLRRKSVGAEYFISSVNAVSKTGELVACDASGSRVGAFPFAAKHLILVVGVNKITKDLESALTRLREFVFPREDARAKKAYGVGSSMNKFVILAGDSAGRTTVVFVKEILGY